MLDLFLDMANAAHALLMETSTNKEFPKWEGNTVH